MLKIKQMIEKKFFTREVRLENLIIKRCCSKKQIGMEIFSSKDEKKDDKEIIDTSIKIIKIWF